MTLATGSRVSSIASRAVTSVRHSSTVSWSRKPSQNPLPGRFASKAGHGVDEQPAAGSLVRHPDHVETVSEWPRAASPLISASLADAPMSRHNCRRSEILSMWAWSCSAGGR